MTTPHHTVKKWAIIVGGMIMLGLVFRPYMDHSKQVSMVTTTGTAVARTADSVGAASPISPMITIHLAGAVMHPGVYEVPADWTTLRLIQHIKLHPNASLDNLKLAQQLRPNSRIKVGYKKGTRSRTRQKKAQSEHGRVGGLVNINTASVAELTRVSGIGPVMAQRIVAYRDQYGPFASISALTYVKGIGPKTVQKMASFLVAEK